MWLFYILISLFTAGIVIKLVHPVLSRGKWSHEDVVTTADKRLALALIILVPLGALLVYLPLGRPDLPGSPRIFSNLEALQRQHIALLSEKPFQAILSGDVSNTGALMSLAQGRIHLKDYEAAIVLLKRAVESSKEKNDPRHRPIAVSLGEIKVEANKGIVGEDAVETFRYVLSLHPDNPIALYFMALHQAQNGDLKAALKIWQELLNDGYPRAYWKQRVREKIIEAQEQLAK